MEPGSVLVDKVIYTASLVSRPQDVDKLLDDLRVITASRNLSMPLNPSDKAKLLEVQRGLEQYLVSKERLRYFTPDSLRLQLEQHMNGGTFNKARPQLFTVVGLSLTLALSLAIIAPFEMLQQRIQVGGAAVFSLLTVGAAWLFFVALSSFQSELRRAFRLICIGIFFLGLALLESPLIDALQWRDYPIVSVLYTVPLLGASTLFYAGNSLYARLVGVKSLWTAAWPLAIVGFALGLVTWFIPHMPTSEPEIIHDSVAAMWAVMLLLPIASVPVLFMTKRLLPDFYKPSVAALAQAMFPIIAVISYLYVVRVAIGPLPEGILTYILFGLTIVMALALLRAGYKFNQAGKY